MASASDNLVIRPYKDVQHGPVEMEEDQHQLAQADLETGYLSDSIRREQRLDLKRRPGVQGQPNHLAATASDIEVGNCSNKSQGNPRTLGSEGTNEADDMHDTTHSSIKKILAKGIKQKKLPTSAITKQKYKIPHKKRKDSHLDLRLRVEELSRAVQRLEI